MSNAFTWWLCFLAACSFDGHAAPGDDVETTPRVVSNLPLDGAIGVALDGSISATFSEAMDPETLTTSTFTLTSGPTVSIPGTVTYADSTVVFMPDVDLMSADSYTATISTDANSGLGVALAAEYSWHFTGDRVVGPGGAPVNLRTAGSYAVLATASISATGATVTGDLGLSPAAATYVTGLSLIADPSNEFSTSAQVIGRIYAADYGVPTPAKLTAAVADMQLAHAEAAARAPGVMNLGAGTIGGALLAPGVYRWNGGLSIPSSVTLTGSATDVWIFQIAGPLDLAASTEIVLAADARPENVFWQVSGAVTLGAMAHLEGVVLAATAVTSGAATTITGRVLSQTAVTITGSNVVQPALGEQLRIQGPVHDHVGHAKPHRYPRLE